VRHVVVQVYEYGAGVDVLGRWWNGAWGRLARRDIWLLKQSRWRVLARQGDSDTGRVLDWEFTTEEEARAMVQRLLDADGPGRWRELDSRQASPPLGYTS
jgi:hypothetical protein